MSIIFRQIRTGKDDKCFIIYKLRTMKLGKITPIGYILRATKLDELPQIVNIFRGEMSLVGPRPLIPEEHRKLRGYPLPVKPGITGLWQLHGCRWSNINTYDHLYITNKLYIPNKCWWYDTVIVSLTVPIIIYRIIKEALRRK